MKDTSLYIFFAFLLCVSHAFSGQARAQSKASESVSAASTPAKSGSAKPASGHGARQLTAGGATKAPSIENTRLNGIVIYDNDKDVNTFGLYSYSVTSPIKRKAQQLMPRIGASGGAMVSDGKLYIYDFAVDYGYVSSANYITFDLATGELLSKKSMGYDLYPVYHHAATAAAKDPTDGTVYCCSYSYHETTRQLGYNLSTWNLEAMTKDSIAVMDAPMRVMACGSDGTLYGITASTASNGNNGGMLVRIDKKTGKTTKIGDTGVRPKYFQSAVINTDNGNFYWFANEEDESANLYQISLTTGKAEKIGPLPNGDQVVGAYVPAAETSDLAPSAATGVSLHFEGGALTGTVAFDIPSKTYSGSDLSGTVSYTVTDGRTQIAGGTGTAGGHVEKEVTVGGDGIHTITVTLSNAEGDSPASDIKQYIGYDTPLAAGNVSLTRAGKLNRLTWTAPEGTVNGGYMDKAELKYKITRMPENTVVAQAQSASAFEETFDSDELRLCHYEVAPVNGQLTGAAAASDTITVGEAITPPYAQDFTEAGSVSLFTVIDTNKDNYTWGHSNKTVRYRGSFTSAADDWLITPPLRMKAGQTYTLGYKAYGISTRNTNKLTVRLGGAATADGMSIILKEETSYSNTSREPAEETVKVTPAADGTYHIGFHISSDKGMGNFTIDNLSVSAPASNGVPAAVTDMAAVPGEKGKLTAGISFTSPSATAGGDALEEPTEIKLLRNGIVIKTFQPSMPVQPQSYQYEDAVDKSGIYIYSAVCSNSNGEGEASSDTIYIGTDKPLSPASVRLKEIKSGSAALSWDASAAAGENGGYVDASAVTYNIYDARNVAVASSVSGTSFTIEDFDANGAQEAVSFCVEAENTEGKSAQRTMSNSILSGKAYGTPYAETFAGAEYTKGPWENETLKGKSYDSKWTPRPDQDHGGDGGSADFGGYTAGASSRLSGPKTDVSGMKNPYLRFWSIMPKGGVRISVMVSSNDGEWKEIGKIKNTEEWTLHGFSLAPYMSERLRVAFTGECLNEYTFAYIDDVEIKDISGNDISLTGMDGSYKARPGIETLYSVRLENNGAEDAEDVELRITDGAGCVLGSSTVSRIAAQTSQTRQVAVSFPASSAGSETKIHATAYHGADGDTRNNTTDAVTVFVEGSALPAPAGLKGTASGTEVTLEWSSPDLTRPAAAKTLEDFESCKPFTTGGFGAWKTVDVDKGSTYVFGEASLWPNAGQPQAFMTFDISSEYFNGLDLGAHFDMTREHGSKLAVCWASDPAKTNIGHNDDWLISPLLDGSAHPVSFSARSYSDKYALESFEVYYSTSGNDVADFTNKIAAVSELPADWTMFCYDLPAGASHFAVRCTSENAFILGIDNVAYYPQPQAEEGLQVSGYNIYRNGMLIGQSTAESFTDSSAQGQGLRYAVSAVYGDKGESALCDAITVDNTSGISSVTERPAVSTANGLSVTGTRGNTVEIYNASGMKVASYKGDVSNVVLPPDLYVIRTCGMTFKAVIK